MMRTGTWMVTTVPEITGAHGRDCPKVPHSGDGYLHAKEDDRPYEVDGIVYCGRCHAWMGLAVPATAEVDRDSLAATKVPTQAEVLQWAVDSFGPIAQNRDERAARLVEEAMEVAQAENVPAETVRRILEHVYSRPPGELGQEIGGCAITLLALAENAGIGYRAELLREWRRLTSKPRAWWQHRHEEKVAAGTANLSPVAHKEGRPRFVSTKRMLAEIIADLEEVAANCPMSAATRGKLRTLIAEESRLLADAAARAVSPP